jgi:hypothetical protein
MIIGSCLLRPHISYRRDKAKFYTEKHALDTNLLDQYVKDTVLSFGLFFILVPAAFWKIYIKKEDLADRS